LVSYFFIDDWGSILDVVPSQEGKQLNPLFFSIYDFFWSLTILEVDSPTWIVFFSFLYVRFSALSLERTFPNPLLQLSLI